jgi:hypothetical protein
MRLTKANMKKMRKNLLGKYVHLILEKKYVSSYTYDVLGKVVSSKETVGLTLEDFTSFDRKMRCPIWVCTKEVRPGEWIKNSLGKKYVEYYGPRLYVSVNSYDRIECSVIQEKDVWKMRLLIEA